MLMEVDFRFTEPALYASAQWHSEIVFFVLNLDDLAVEMKKRGRAIISVSN